MLIFNVQMRESTGISLNFQLKTDPLQQLFFRNFFYRKMRRCYKCNYTYLNIHDKNSSSARYIPQRILLKFRFVILLSG